MSEPGSHPYSDLPASAFWKSAVANGGALGISGLWDPKFQILPGQRVATYGSCFAQHIGRSLRDRGFSWYIAEPAPAGMSAANLARFNYDLFTCRTGNIYTASLLKQWVEWALEEKPVPDEYWVSNGRYFDPFRPAVEPDGFESLDEMRASRAYAIAAFQRSLTEAKIFVFTMGMTESWFNKSHGYDYPLCPGTAAGSFDATQHEFRNQGFGFVRANLGDAMEKIRSVNKHMRFLLTVSPVPLTATYSGRHVLVATTASKSILRAVAGQLCAARGGVDYFPSYEIITSPVFGGQFFEPNMRSVSKTGVDFVMDSFFADQHAKFGDQKVSFAQQKTSWLKAFNPFARKTPETRSEDVVCEEQLLEAFGKHR